MIDEKKLINELFQLWKDFAEVGELHIGPKFSKKYDDLEEKVIKFNLHDTILREKLQ